MPVLPGDDVVPTDQQAYIAEKALVIANGVQGASPIYPASPEKFLEMLLDEENFCIDKINNLQSA